VRETEDRQGRATGPSRPGEGYGDAMTTFHDFEMTSITGDPVPLSTFSGQMCLVVNVASACGLTPQYEGLQTLHESNDDLVVLGFPCNQFGGQEPGTNEEICEFTTSRFNVTFPMFDKIEVNGDGADPLYQWLKSEQPGDGEPADIAWNFEKFLVDADGNVVERFGPMTTPDEVASVLDTFR
jgi:glutathione peroxidase